MKPDATVAEPNGYCGGWDYRKRKKSDVFTYIFPAVSTDDGGWGVPGFDGPTKQAQVWVGVREAADDYGEDAKSYKRTFTLDQTPSAIP